MKLRHPERALEVDTAWGGAAGRLGMRDFSFAEDDFSTVYSSTEEPRQFRKRESGIYFWLAENGEAYVGQAVDVQARLRQHFKTHRDVVCAAFLPVVTPALGSEERRCILSVQAGFRMRNILLVHETTAAVPLDRFVTRDDTIRFLAEGNPDEWITEARRAFPLAEVRQRPKLRQLEEFGEDRFLVDVPVSEFILAAVPRPIATEGRFWSVTLFPDNFFARVNVGDQEVLTTQFDENGFYARLMSASPITEKSQQMRYRNAPYVTVLDWENMAELLHDTERMRPVRKHALWLARHTTPLHIRSHCPAIFVIESTDRYSRLRRDNVGAGRLLK